MRTARFRERALALVVDLALVVALGAALGWPPAFWAALLVLYGALSLWVLRGRTPGKLLWRLRVVPAGGGTLRLWQITLRPLLSLLEIALLFGGFLVALLGRDRLALHDLLLGTRVVKSARA